MKMDWFSAAFVAMLGFSLVFLLYKKITNLGVRTEVLILYYFIISGIALFFFMLFTKVPFTVSKNAFIFIFIAACVGIIANILIINSIRIAPNPGYTLAVVGLNTLVVAFASIFIYKSEFTLIKGLGTLLAVIGVILLGL